MFNKIVDFVLKSIYNIIKSLDSDAFIITLEIQYVRFKANSRK